MKKSLIIFSIVCTTLSLTAFGYINWNDPITDQPMTSKCNIHALDKSITENMDIKVASDFFYNIDTRFRAIKKGTFDKARSILDFLPKTQTARAIAYQSVKVIILDDSRQTDIRETGNSDVLTTAQIKLLRSADYSTNILIQANYQQKIRETGKLENSSFTPYLTIVPERQATYVPGKDALLQYLKENSKEETAYVHKDKLQPGKLYFTVSKKGTISNVKLTATSGYPSIDKTMIELISKAPGKWNPAENSIGEKVEQELVFSFGIIGC